MFEKGMGKNYIEATQKILALIKENPYITRKEIAENWHHRRWGKIPPV